MPVLPYEFTEINFGLEWVTSVTPTYETEYRQSLRELPRLQFNVTCQLASSETRAVTSMLESSAGIVDVPDWRYAQRSVASVAGLYTDLTLNLLTWYPEVGDQLLIWNSPEDYVVATMEALNASSIDVDGALPIDVTAHTWIIPLLSMALTEAPIFTLTGNDTADLQLQGVAVDYKDLSSFATALPTFNGTPVLSSRDLLLDVNSNYVITNYESFDPGLGQLAVNQVREAMQATFFLSQISNGTQSLFNMEAMLHLLRGRSVPFWKPSWLPDFVPKGVSGVGTTLTCEPAIFALDGPLDTIAIEYTNGDLVLHTVTNAVSTATETTLTLDPALTLATSVDNVTTVSRAEHHRLDSDLIEMQLQTGGVASMSVPTIRIPT